jgi:hypothetical protein
VLEPRDEQLARFEAWLEPKLDTTPASDLRAASALPAAAFVVAGFALEVARYAGV